MAPYKNQHFVPCCYLKFFSVDGTWPDARKARVWFTDGSKSICVPVSSVGVEKYTYSKENPEFDRQFHNMEQHYPQIIEKILGGERRFNRFDYYGLIMIMVDFNLRNIAYENRSEVERMHVYEAMSRAFIGDMFAEAPGHGSDKPEMLKWLEANWDMQIFSPETSETFITSDNPSIIFTEPKTERPMMILLPIHPKCAIVAYDKRGVTPSGNTVSDADLSVFNGLQINMSVQHIFSNIDMKTEPDNWEKLQAIVEKEKPQRYVDGEKWQTGFFSMASPLFDKFTCMKKVEE